jgi:hypothetical protein
MSEEAPTSCPPAYPQMLNPELISADTHLFFPIWVKVTPIRHTLPSRSYLRPTTSFGMSDLSTSSTGGIEDDKGIPNDMFISGINVNFNRPVDEGAFSEIYRGTYQGKEVAVKRLRVPTRNGDGMVDFRKVCYIDI